MEAEANPRAVPAALPAPEFESRMGLSGPHSEAHLAWLCGSRVPGVPPMHV